jgi:hypothetical protein
MSTSMSSDRIIALETGKCQRGRFYKAWVWDFEKQLLVLGGRGFWFEDAALKGGATIGGKRGPSTTVGMTH